MWYMVGTSVIYFMSSKLQAGLYALRYFYCVSYFEGNVAESVY